MSEGLKWARLYRDRGLVCDGASIVHQAAWDVLLGIYLADGISSAEYMGMTNELNYSNNRRNERVAEGLPV